MVGKSCSLLPSEVETDCHLSSQFEPHIHQLLISRNPRIETHRVAAEFYETKAAVEFQRLWVLGNALKFQLFVTRSPCTFYAGGGESRTYAQVPIFFVDANAKIRTVAHFALPSDFRDARRADNLAVDFSKDFNLVGAVGHVFEITSLLLGGKSVFVGVRQQKIRLTVRQQKHVKHRLAISEIGVAEGARGGVF